MLHRPMKKQFILSFALALGLAAFGLTFNVEKNIRYSDAAARCVLDVKWPAGVTNFATVVNFHGGGLVKGSKSSRTTRPARPPRPRSASPTRRRPSPGRSTTSPATAATRRRCS